MIADQTKISRGIIQVERAARDLRQGLPVAVTGAQGRVILALSPETTPPEEVSRWRAEAIGGALLLTANRLRRLGVQAPQTGNMRLTLAPDMRWEDILALADPLQHTTPRFLSTNPLGPEENAVLRLARHAALLPVMYALGMENAGDVAARFGLLGVCAADIEAYEESVALTLVRASEARVPLADAPDARVLAFRPRGSAVEHLAIVVGSPPPRGALVRVHSSCVTGDILGSLRCDCGEQLRASLAAMQAGGGGALLYLYQEGRGIGIAAKLNAYALQDGGLDTVDANEAMGFEADERSFRVAAAMLTDLGLGHIRLMTNNPHKVREMEALGVTVAARVPLVISANPHNAAYLDAKTRRCGHVMGED